MYANTTKTKKDRSKITFKRAQAIILCYGGNGLAWPEQERQEVEALLKQSESLRALQKQMLEVDEFMGFIEAEAEVFDRQTALCAERILADLPGQNQPVVNTGYRKNRLGIWRKKACIMLKSGWLHRYPVYGVTGLVLAVMLITNTVFFETKTVQDLTITEYMVLYMDDDDQGDSEASDEMEMLAFWVPQVWEDDEVF